MELEFDKEMDAILRKARGAVSVSAKTAHLDADTIAAFVENALPQHAKLRNIEHFADCDSCRKQLSFAMSLNEPSERTEAASTPAPIAEIPIPWYSKLFRTPNLALAMGALVVAFSGIIGYLAIQNRSAADQSSVAVANASKPMASEPSTGRTASNSATEANKTAGNTSVNPAAPAASPATVTNPTTSPLGTTSSADEAPRVDQPLVASKPADTDTYGGTADKEKPESKSAGTQPAPQPKTAEPTETRDNKAEALKSGADVTLADRGMTNDDSISREGPYSPKKKDSGPTRAGPSVTQQQSNANIYNQTQIRSVGGKSFDNRGGVWYDTAYNGQPMIRVTRGSDAYKDLDGSVKRAAESLGGTVVVVWKAKAYRIQ